MEHMAITGRLCRQRETLRARQTRGVAHSPLAAIVVPGVDVFELGAEHAGMQVVKPAVEAEAMHITSVRAVIAELAHLRIDVGVVRDACAAVAERAEILLDNETGGGRVAQLTNLESLAVRADSLGVVLN